MRVLAICNPVCGDASAVQFYETHVAPLLKEATVELDAPVLTTTHDGHAGQFVTQYTESVEGPFTVILASGDGTLHEIVQTLTNTPPKGVRASAPPARLSFVLLPCGTANALYSSLFPPQSEEDATSTDYKLSSLRAFLASGTTVPLTLALTTLSPPPRSHNPPRTAVSAVVASTSLHASILHDAEALRASVPGLERFKRAAAQNLARWYSASVTLFPAQATGRVELWDPAARRFAPHPQSTESDPLVDLSGPFAYFLSTANVDRLEPAFRITPHARDVPPKGPALDVVVLRPERDPSVEMDSREVREAFAEKAKAVLGGAYEDGAHTVLRYAEDGCVLTEGDGPLVVEYFRCGGWEWEPDDIDDRAHLVCADGEVFTIDKGGRATCAAVIPVDDKSGFAVFV
ncbi:uncharacterized protein LAESUDRAFT_729243 [Laetiporus sulphureus 93-53]|uniref:DAGKc domain-containing protein n=1 Tax=Laetiporus sulphureus 93-53 TaxID=1314785 RepID=A0A165CU64_9APHY|nr:uncharacterized protein LAESUDRAFT_729243 [Laetiporus sulphureus 93-53]KZT03440.1 hypothetical protein LAESUDRAFT_729243 [Laetiporus sulphureus 93-53]